MKIYKPDNLALLYRNFRLGQEKLLSLGVMAMFSYGRSGSADLLSEAQLWKNAGAAVGADAMLDGGMPKPAGEFLAYGAAHAAQGSQVQQLEVVLSVAGVRKALRVAGDRQFGTLSISAPIPFARMPLGAAQAFGGEGYADNPQGKGYVEVKDASGLMTRPLPNVELPNQLMIAGSDKPAPAGYWALPPEAPQRTRLLGAFDDRWLQKTWPHLPEDTQPEYFHAAPPDQRLRGFFRGDEAFEIVNMHPQQTHIAGRLPAVRARCFVNQRDGGGEKFSEVEARAETVWLFPELECGIVLYRAVVRVAETDADDVLHVMAEWEELADAPQSFEHYHELFKSRLPGAATPAQPAPAEEAVAPAPAAPVAGAPVAAAVAAVAGVAAVAALSPEMAELEKMVADLERQARAMMDEHGLTDKDIEQYVNPPVEQEAPLSVEELEKSIAQLEQDTKKMMADHNLTDQDIQKYIQPEATEQKPASIGELKQMFVDLEQQTDKMLADSGMTKEQLREVLAANPETAHLAAEMGAPQVSIDQLFANLEATTAAAAAVPVAAALVAAAPAPEKKAEPEMPEPPPPQPKLTREQVVDRHARKESLRNLDLSGLDLSGLNLEGADFGAAILDATLFGGSKLAGSNFREALLRGTDFSEADLSRACLSMASADSARLGKARLNEADLSGADFTGGDFEAVQMQRANLQGATFDRAKMNGLAATECSGSQASFAEAELNGADFARADLGRAKFNQALLASARFDGARCGQAEFYGAQATQASFADSDLRSSRADATSQFGDGVFARAQMQRANWEGAAMKNATFERAVLNDADFSRVQAKGARFTHTSAKATSFAKADLNGADLNTINLFKGSLRAAKVEQASLQMANLFGVDFDDVAPAPTRASIEGSNIGRTVLALRGMKAG